MNTFQLTEIFRDAIMTGFKVAAPILIVSILVGLVISIIQAATSINEQTMTFVPKIVAVFVTLLIFGPWIMELLITFTTGIISQMATVGQ